MTAKTFSHAWLLSPAPESRRQAAWGQRYQAWLAFRRNPLAMAGLIVVVLLLALSLLAPVLATHDPNIQDLANRLQPWSADHWLGTDELGRDMLARLMAGGRGMRLRACCGCCSWVSPGCRWPSACTRRKASRWRWAIR